jgi:hypothetical protein
MPFTSTWKQRLPSSSNMLVVSRGLIPGGGTWPVVSMTCGTGYGWTSAVDIGGSWMGWLGGY